MRKFDCNSFRITGNTNFKKKLTSFVSKSVWGNPAMKVKVETEIRLFQRYVPVETQLKFLIDAMKTSQQSCLEFERVS